jgi:hypothetical protein
MSRRQFGEEAVIQAAAWLSLAKPKPPSLSDRLFHAAAKFGSKRLDNGFHHNFDIARAAGLPIPEKGHYLWFGNCGQFRTDSRVAGIIADEIGSLLGTNAHRESFVAFCCHFFGNYKVSSESPAIILICPGHVTVPSAFEQKQLTTVLRSSDGGDLKILPDRLMRKPRLGFDGGWRGYGVRFDVVNGFLKPIGRSKVSLIRRRLRREYYFRGAELASRDFIVNYGVAEADRNCADFRAIKAGLYYPNIEPARRLFIGKGYLDLTNVTFIRTVGRSQNVVHAHQVDLVFNLGFARGGLTTNEQSDPDYILDLNTIVRPLERILDQYPSQRSILENEV